MVCPPIITQCPHKLLKHQCYCSRRMTLVGVTCIHTPSVFVCYSLRSLKSVFISTFSCIMRSSKTRSLMASCLHLPSAPGRAPFPIFTEILVLFFLLMFTLFFCVCICACISLCICIRGSQHIIDGILLTPVLVLQFQFTQRRHCH